MPVNVPGLIQQFGQMGNLPPRMFMRRFGPPINPSQLTNAYGSIPTQDPTTALANGIAMFLSNRQQAQQQQDKIQKAQNTLGAVSPMIQKYYGQDAGPMMQAMMASNDGDPEGLLNQVQGLTQDIGNANVKKNQDLADQNTTHQQAEALRGVAVKQGWMKPEDAATMPDEAIIKSIPNALLKSGEDTAEQQKHVLSPDLQNSVKFSTGHLGDYSAQQRTEAKMNPEQVGDFEKTMGGAYKAAQYNDQQALQGPRLTSAQNQATVSTVHAQNAQTDEAARQQETNLRIRKLQNELNGQGGGGYTYPTKDKDVQGYIQNFNKNFLSLTGNYKTAEQLFTHLSEVLPKGSLNPPPPLTPMQQQIAASNPDLAQTMQANRLAAYTKTVHNAVNGYMYGLSKQAYPVPAAVSDQLRMSGMFSQVNDEFNHPSAGATAGHFDVTINPSKLPPGYQNMTPQQRASYVESAVKALVPTAIVTATTNGDHAQGQYSHANGYKADFVIPGYEGIQTPQWQRLKAPANPTIKGSNSFQGKLDQVAQARQNLPMDDDTFHQSLNELYNVGQQLAPHALQRIAQTPMSPQQRAQMLNVLQRSQPSLFQEA